MKKLLIAILLAIPLAGIAQVDSTNWNDITLATISESADQWTIVRGTSVLRMSKSLFLGDVNSLISTNTSDISTNAGLISGNTTNISANTSAIALNTTHRGLETNPHSVTLTQLLTGTAVGQVPIWNGSTWYAGTVSGGGGSTYTAGNGLWITPLSVIQLNDSILANTQIELSSYYYRLRHQINGVDLYIDGLEIHAYAGDAFVQVDQATGAASIGSTTASMTFDGSDINITGISTDNTEEYVVTIDYSTGLISRRAVSSIGGGGGELDTISATTILTVNEKVRAIFVFGAVGSNNFTTGSYYQYGSFYNPGPDTIVIDGMANIMVGTTPSMSYNLKTHAQLNSGSATSVWSSNQPISSTTTRDVDINPTNPYILPGQTCWAVTPVVGTLPDYWEGTMYGHLLNRSTDLE